MAVRGTYSTVLASKSSMRWWNAICQFLFFKQQCTFWLALLTESYRGSENSHYDHKFWLMEIIWFNNEIFLSSSAICRLREAVAVDVAVAVSKSVAVAGSRVAHSERIKAACNWAPWRRQAVGAWRHLATGRSRKIPQADAMWRHAYQRVSTGPPIDGANHLHWRHRPAQSSCGKQQFIFFLPSLTSNCLSLLLHNNDNAYLNEIIYLFENKLNKSQITCFYLAN